MTLANKITIVRICLIPAFAFYTWQYGASVVNGRPAETIRLIATLLFVLAAAMDGLDGFIARRFNQFYRKPAPIFPEPQALLTPASKLPGTDGRKMSKSYGNTVLLTDTGVSRKHVGIKRVEGGYELADLGSTNGVYVNGEKVARRKLEVGDVIRVGTTEIVFRV